jgi:hypothetical protein
MKRKLWKCRVSLRGVLVFTPVLAVRLQRDVLRIITPLFAFVYERNAHNWNGRDIETGWRMGFIARNWLEFMREVGVALNYRHMINRVRVVQRRF